MACSCEDTVDFRRAEIEAAVKDASEFLRRQGLAPDCPATNQQVRNVLYALACQNWRVSRTRHPI